MSVKIQTWIEIIHCLQWGYFHICTVTCAVFVLSRHRHGLSLIRVFVVRIEKPWVLSYPLSTHPSHSPSLIRVFVVRIEKPWVLSYPLSAHPSHSPSLIRIFVVRIRKPYILSYPLSAHPRLIRIFAVRIKKPWVLRYLLSAQRRLIRLGGCRLGWSEFAGSTGYFVGFVMLRLIWAKRKVRAAHHHT